MASNRKDSNSTPRKASRLHLAQDRIGATVKGIVIAIVRRPIALRRRRAHKSLVLTRRRDIPRATPLPGYVSFTASVWRLLWQHKKTFGVLLGFFLFASVLLIGVAQQDEYRSITDAFQGAEEEAGGDPFGTTTRAVGVFGATFFGSLSGSLSEMQQFYLVGLYVIMWMVVVWLLRHLMAENSVKIRDALYSACAPLISTACVCVLMLLQAVPGALGIFIFTIASTSGVLGDGGAPAMAFGLATALLVLLSLYWLASSFFALIIVTLPGTYPMTAIRGASDIALGRRLILLLRLLWLVLHIALIWIIIVLPVLLIDMWVGLSWSPLVALTVQATTGLSLIYGFSYIFMLYRRMIDDTIE